jgi:hypothetical protein
MVLDKERLQGEMANLRQQHEQTRELFDMQAGGIQLLEQLIALLDQPEKEGEHEDQVS